MPTFFHQRAKNEKTKKWMGAQNILNGNNYQCCILVHFKLTKRKVMIFARHILPCNLISRSVTRLIIHNSW